MDVFVAGKHKRTLTQNDFKAQGGEGVVYVQGGTAYKIYADPNKMIPTPKIEELARLTHSNIIRPKKSCWTGRVSPSAIR